MAGVPNIGQGRGEIVCAHIHTVCALWCVGFHTPKIVQMVKVSRLRPYLVSLS